MGKKSKKDKKKKWKPKKRDLLQELEDRAAQKAADRDSEALHDVDRIVGLKLWTPPKKKVIKRFNREHVDGTAYKGGFRFNAAQVAAFMAYQETKGGFFPIGVGVGKTAICLYIASMAYRRGLKKILLLWPAQVYAQLMKYDLAWARNRFTLGYPVIPLGKISAARRRLAVENKRRGLFILPYSLLSVKDTEYMLDRIDPDLVIADEGHLLKNVDVARTKRAMNLLDDRPREFVTMSGTMTDKSIKDYHHLISYALGEGSPLPLEGHTANDWAGILDSGSEVTEDGDATGPLLPLIHWARQHFPKKKFAPTQAGFRKAYKYRLTCTPGVFATKDASVKCSLVFTNIPAGEMKDHEGGEKLAQLIENVTELWETPTGDEIEYPIHSYKWLYELSAGFYNNLYWPKSKAYSKRLGIDKKAAKKLLKRSKKHHAAKQDYNRELRSFLQGAHVSGLDSPFLVGGLLFRISQDKVKIPNNDMGRKVRGLYAKWQAAKDLEFEGMPERDREVVRVCDYKIVALLKWLKTLSKTQEKKGGIIWVYNRGMGQWVYERVLAEGHDVIYCPSGEQFNEKIIDSRKQWVVASIRAHGTGKNLQHHENQYYFQVPRQATMFEQSLGRLHRQGQLADVLNVVMANSIEFDRMNMAAALNDALYIHQTTGSPQKLIYGGYNPVPQIFPDAVLQERGFQVQTLNKKQQKELSEKFGIVLA